MRDSDRKHLARAAELARNARRAPDRLPRPVEAVYAAVLAEDGHEIAKSVFSSGDPKDAVSALQLGGALSENTTLYLTLEPSASFERLPPATESIRQLGVKRVVIGAENPGNRSRGIGVRTLLKQGMDVVLADGEEARACQMLYEDYAKVCAKNLPLLKMAVELVPDAADSDRAVLRPYRAWKSLSSHFDAILAMDYANAQSASAWAVLLDESAASKKAEDRCLIFQPQEIAKAGERIYAVPVRDGRIDLASVLRKLKELGFLSVLCHDDDRLFRQCVESGLVDSIFVQVRASEAPVQLLSRLSRMELHIASMPSRTMRLTQPRLVEADGDSLLVEAKVSLL